MIAAKVARCDCDEVGNLAAIRLKARASKRVMA
jgi:hypothetical protein